MPCSRKRAHELRVVFIDDIAFRLGYLCKRVLAFDPTQRPNKRSLSPAKRPCVANTNLIKGKDATFWSQAASSLSLEALQLREALHKRDREYASLLECNLRLVASYKEMELRLTDADRELTYLRTDPFQESRGYSSIISTIPLNTEGKDVFYWHQTCRSRRSVQLQYLEAKRKIDEKMNQFVMLSKRIKELEQQLR
jgi:hypothetical protein